MKFDEISTKPMLKFRQNVNPKLGKILLTTPIRPSPQKTRYRTAKVGTHHVRSAGPVRMRGGVSCWAVCIVVGVPQVPLPPLPLVYDKVDGHLALQTGDVSMTEVVTKLVYLKQKEEEKLLRYLFSITEIFYKHILTNLCMVSYTPMILARVSFTSFQWKTI